MKIVIIGAGISGLTTAFFLNQFSPESQITIIEKDKVGGQMKTEAYEDCTLELGENDIYIKYAFVKRLFQEAGVTLVEAHKDIDKRFILKESQLHKAPQSFEKMNKTSLLFLTEKIKVSKAFQKKYSFWPTMSIHEAFKSVFGQTSANYFSSPLIRYLFYSEAEDIELASAFPEIYKMLEESPNITEALKKVNDVDEANENIPPSFFTVNEGLATFPEKMKDHLKSKDIKFEAAKVQTINKRQNQYSLKSGGQKFTDYDKVIFTIAPTELSKIFKNFDQTMSALFSEIAESYVSTVYHAWPSKVLTSNGHGIFCPRNERMSFLFTLFISNLYPEKSPSNVFLTRTYLSGGHDIFDDDDLAKMSLESLKRLFKVQQEPLWSKVYRSNGVPKYKPGYHEQKEKILSLASGYKGLELHGQAFGGLSAGTLIEKSYQLATRLGSELG